MVATQHKPVIGSAEYVELPASPEIQEGLSKADAALPVELRERHPVVARDEIKTRFPDHWIALLPTHVDHDDRLVAGRLVACEQNWPTFDLAVQAFRRENPGLFPFTYFTGRDPMGRDVVHV
jgi:hypothetical protein